MLHQSDRTLPRTHINTNYTITTRKNASEMSGVLLVILIVFLTDEGEKHLDEAMAEIGSTKFIKLLELLLLLEVFCQSETHTFSNVKLFQKFIPFFLNFYKETLQRTDGCGMKLIKYHLPNHFGDDILRFGSMLNFDTGIGESHHKTEAKYPSNNTQRRKAQFEIQTAIRQIESLAINIGMADINVNDKSKIPLKNSPNENKWYRYSYNIDLGVFNKKTNKPCKWKDSVFQKSLSDFCEYVYRTHAIKGSLNFFSQHNRNNNVICADPSYASGEPWYDWVNIQWSNEVIPAKLLLFLEIEIDQLSQAIHWGASCISTEGTYAFLYSMPSSSLLQKAHESSLLTKYGNLDVNINNEPILQIVDVDCIQSFISAIPYKCESNIIESIDWILLCHKTEWYNIFISFMKKEISEFESATSKSSNKKSKTKH